MNEQDVGLLLNDNALMYRDYFEEAVTLIGIYVIYMAPIAGKKYNGYGEFEDYFLPPVRVGSIFEEHPKQSTMKKLGWAAETTETPPIIHLPYNLPNLQVGGIVIVPSGVDNSKGRVFRIIAMDLSEMIYPSTIVCKLAPEFKSSSEKSDLNHTDNNFSVLLQNEEYVNASKYDDR